MKLGHIKYISLIFLLLLGLSSCKTRKTYSTTGYEKLITKSDWKIKLHWKGESLSSKARLEAAEDEGLYLSLRPFPFIELARFWFMPDEIVVVDLIDKRYARITYRQIPKDLGTKLSYRKVENFIFKSLEDEQLNGKAGQTIRLGKGENEHLNFHLLRNEYLSTTEGLHLEPIIKDDYRQMSLHELNFLLKYLLGKTK